MKAKNLEQLVKYKTIEKGRTARGMFSWTGMTYDTYRNIVTGKNKPYETTIKIFCSIFEIDRKQFDKLLANTVPKEQ